MSKQSIVLAAGALVLFGLGVGASLGVVGNEESPATPPAATTGVHTMEGGMTMTGPMEEMGTTSGEEMPGMTMTGPMEEMGTTTGEEMPGMTMTGPMEETETHGEDEMPGMTMTEP